MKYKLNAMALMAMAEAIAAENTYKINAGSARDNIESDIRLRNKDGKQDKAVNTLPKKKRVKRSKRNSMAKMSRKQNRK